MTAVRLAAPTLWVLSLCAVTLSGCGLTGMFGDRPPVSDANMQAVHAAAVSGDRAVIWVASNGCTVREDLQAVVERRFDGPTLTLVRLKPDDCGVPQSVEMTWTFEELGLKPGEALAVANPYRLPPG